MKYTISYTKPHNHYIDIEFVAAVNASETLVQLPAWRPGRYELGNFAKNVQKWAAFDENGKALSFSKIKKDCWKVETAGAKELHIKYNYYAAEINAGSTFLDSKQLYINPVNCCVFIPERINENLSVEIQVPADYKMAIGKEQTARTENAIFFNFTDFHELLQYAD